MAPYQIDSYKKSQHQPDNKKIVIQGGMIPIFFKKNYNNRNFILFTPNIAKLKKKYISS